MTLTKPGGLTLAKPGGRSFPVDPPVVLAPMAGITNVAFRQLCREQGAGIYVCEMITSVALAVRNPKTEKMIEFGPAENPRSMQLYSVDPIMTAKAVRRIVDEDLADHIDLNFGCSVPQDHQQGRRVGDPVEAPAVRGRSSRPRSTPPRRPASRSPSRCARASTTTT